MPLTGERLAKSSTSTQVWPPFKSSQLNLPYS